MKKIMWLMVSCLMILSLVLASCAPKVTEEKEAVTTPTEKKEVVTTPTEKEKEVAPAGPEMVKVRLTKLDGTVVEKMVEKPQYGGTIIAVSERGDPTSFDPADGTTATEIVVGGFIYEKLLIGDYTRSLAGTGEFSFTHWSYTPTKMCIGHVAEGWEQPDPLTVIWHIRKGIHFHNIPPVNGRELTAEDVAYSIMRQKNSPMIAPATYGSLESVKATDKYTVVAKLKYPDYTYTDSYQAAGSVQVVTYAREMVEKYGNLNDWKSACGTGPWMMSDYIRGSIVIYKKNPDYWKKDPFFPDNTLPYADSVKQVIIPDLSTRIATLRAGKVDITLNHSPGTTCWQDSESLKRTNPEINQLPYTDSAGILSIVFRVDKPPFNDIRVRQALTLAIDQDSVLKDYLRGYGELHNFPVMREWGEEIWTPIEKLPTQPTIPGSRCSAQEIYTYNPEKAKQLLAEAGYPNGFKTNIICGSKEIDATSLTAAYWKDIGVDLMIDVKDPAVKLAAIAGTPKTFPHGMAYQLTLSTDPFGTWSAGFLWLAAFNVGNIHDPLIEQTYRDMVAEPDVAKRSKLSKDLALYAVEQAYKISGPHQYVYNFWQPWLKNCEGQATLSGKGMGNSFAYYWVDQDLKEKMTGRR